MIKYLKVVPRVIFSALELQCLYCTENSKAFRTIYRLFNEHLSTYGPNDTKPFDERKINNLKTYCLHKNPNPIH